MRFTDRKEFTYDPQLFQRYDVITAGKFHRQYVERSSPRNPLPKVFEIDRQSASIDPLWHYDKNPYKQFSRELDMPGIYKQDKLNWSLRRYGKVAEQKMTVVLDSLILQELDYFPNRGDVVYWSGYRWVMTEVNLDPAGYWQQTNVWLGLSVTCMIDVEGDERPSVNPGVLAPAEISKSAQPSTPPHIPNPAPHLPPVPLERF